MFSKMRGNTKRVQQQILHQSPSICVQAMPHSLDTLLSLALHPELLPEVADSGVIPRLLAIATHRMEGCAAMALQLVQEICTLPAGRVNVAREDGARALANLVQTAQPAVLSDPALHGVYNLGVFVCQHEPVCARNTQRTVGKLVSDSL